VTANHDDDEEEVIEEIIEIEDSFDCVHDDEEQPNQD